MSKIQSNVSKITVFFTYVNGKTTNSYENNCKKQQNQRKTKENAINEGLLRADGRDRGTGGRGAQVKGHCHAGAVGDAPCILCIIFFKALLPNLYFFLENLGPGRGQDRAPWNFASGIKIGGPDWDCLLKLIACDLYLIY